MTERPSFLTEAELSFVRARPALAFGYCLEATQPLDRVLKSVGGTALLSASYRLFDGFGVNIAGDSAAISHVFSMIEQTGVDPKDYRVHLLRDAEGQVPVYDMDKRGATGLPLRTTSVCVPR